MRVALVLAFVLLSLAVAVPAQADWDLGDPYKYLQEPLMTPLLGLFVNATTPNILADGFECRETGWVTDIHIWGGWLDSAPEEDVTFTLSIHENVPASESPTGYSMPGEVLWTQVFGPGDFLVRTWVPPFINGWLDPPSAYTEMLAIEFFQYNFFIDPATAFFQEGTFTDPIIYWLDVQAEPLDPADSFGWLNFEGNLYGDAVWTVGVEPYSGEWDELIYPEGHMWVGGSIDLAFVITSLAPTDVDWGDAPDPNYPTLESSYGASHAIDPALYMGTAVDPELGSMTRTASSSRRRSSTE